MQNAFDSIKGFLLNPPVLMGLIEGKPLIPLYITTLDFLLRALLAQHNYVEKEMALYYLRMTMVGAKNNLSLIVKTCLALVFAVQKLRHNLLTTTVHLISRADPIKYIMSRPTVQGRFVKWTMLLLKFNIHYIPQCGQ